MGLRAVKPNYIYIRVKRDQGDHRRVPHVPQLQKQHKHHTNTKRKRNRQNKKTVTF